MKNSKNKSADLFDETPTGPQDDFGAMLEASMRGPRVTFTKGDKVEVEVLSVGKEEVFVSVSGQDGMVPRAELLNAEGELEVGIGDKLSLYIIKRRDELWLLTKRASSKALSESLEDAFDLETPVEGKVLEVCNGGFRVEVMHKVAFCPISQMDLKPIANPEQYIGQKFDFRVTEFKEGGRKLVVSRRKVLEMDRAEREGEFLDKIKVGDEVQGRVTRMETFGAFVEIAPGFEGLVHISEIGWSRLAHPSEALKTNEVITAKVLKIEEDDRGRLKVALSRKQASEDPWLAIVAEWKVGQLLEGRLREKAHFGWLVELRPGVTGLLPKSALKESGGTLTEDRALEQKKVGETLKLVIGSISPTERRISLTLPRGQDDGDWQAFSAGQKTSGMGTLGDQFSKLFNPNSGSKK